jgi:hypothetical protein
MPDQLFTYYIENPTVYKTYKQWEVGGVMVIRLEIEPWVISKYGTIKGRLGSGRGMGAPGFWGPYVY